MFLSGNADKATELSDQILKILYASEEEQVQIDDDGNLTIIPAEGQEENLVGNEEEEEKEQEQEQE